MPVPGPLRPSTVFVQIILTSKWKGVSLKVSRRNWQETGPGEEKVNQLFKTNCNKWHFNRLLKDVQQSIIQLYLCQYSSKVGRECDRSQSIPVVVFQPRVRWLTDQYRLMWGKREDSRPLSLERFPPQCGLSCSSSCLRPWCRHSLHLVFPCVLTQSFGHHPASVKISIDHMFRPYFDSGDISLSESSVRSCTTTLPLQRDEDLPVAPMTVILGLYPWIPVDRVAHLILAFLLFSPPLTSDIRNEPISCKSKLRLSSTSRELFSRMSCPEDSLYFPPGRGAATAMKDERLTVMSLAWEHVR